MLNLNFSKLQIGKQSRPLTRNKLFSRSASESLLGYVPVATANHASAVFRPTSHVCRVCLLPFLGLIIAANGYSQTQSANQAQWFAKGNNAYTQGNYAAAIESYNHIVQSGIDNEWVFYNMGNAYFKQNRLGMAILCYEKATRLAPGEKEIRENLEFVHSRKVDTIDAPTEFFLIQWMRRFFNLLSLNQETGLVVLFSFLGGLSIFLFFAGFAPQFRYLYSILALVFLGLTLLFGVSNALRIYHFTHDQAGIVMVQKADILSGPAPGNPTLFSLHEGTRVEIRQGSGDWLQINLSNGWSGWVRKNDLDLI